MKHLIVSIINSRAKSLYFYISRVMASLILLSACVGPPALHDAVIGYDKVTNKLEQEFLLLNIARAHHMYNVHAAVTGSIAATFDFSTR